MYKLSLSPSISWNSGASSSSPCLYHETLINLQVKLQAPILFGLSQLNLLAGQRYCSEGSTYTDDDDEVQTIAGHINSGRFVLSCSASSCKNTEGIYDARDVSQDCQEETYPELHLPKQKAPQLWSFQYCLIQNFHEFSGTMSKDWQATGITKFTKCLNISVLGLLVFFSLHRSLWTRKN